MDSLQSYTFTPSVLHRQGARLNVDQASSESASSLNQAQLAQTGRASAMKSLSVLNQLVMQGEAHASPLTIISTCQSLLPADGAACRQDKDLCEKSMTPEYVLGEVYSGKTRANQGVCQLKVEVEALKAGTSADSQAAKDPADMSYAEFWQKVTAMISKVKTDYVDFYANLMEKYAKLYQSWNDNVVTAGANAVSKGEDGNELNFSSWIMGIGYDNFRSEVTQLANELGEVPGWNKGMSDAQKEAIRASLQPAFILVEVKGEPDKVKIEFDLSSFDQMTKYPAGKSPISTAAYQAWLASFNSVGSTLQSNMQSFAQRYTQINSTFDNLNKVLSGMISSLGEAAREVYRSI